MFVNNKQVRDQFIWKTWTQSMGKYLTGLCAWNSTVWNSGVWTFHNAIYACIQRTHQKDRSKPIFIYFNVEKIPIHCRFIETDFLLKKMFYLLFQLNYIYLNIIKIIYMYYIYFLNYFYVFTSIKIFCN